MTTAVVDIDYIKYAAAGVGETRSIVAVHKQSGREHPFTNRTEFWGRGKNKDGGWLGELNKGRTSPFLADDFEILDVQTPEPIENVLHTAKMMFEGGLKAIDADNYVSFIGKGDSFRVERSTLLKYKGQRSELLKPLYLDDVTQYLQAKYKPIECTSLEADDWCVIEAYKKKDHVVIGVDKDYNGCPIFLFNPNYPELGIRNCNHFGELWRDGKGKVRGIGRLFFYFQMCSGDTSDNYNASCFSDVKWGDVKAYDILRNLRNDKEAFVAIEGIFKKLYPEQKTIVGWRGDEIVIDWKYVASEMWDMARMRRWEDDVVTFSEACEKVLHG